MTTKEIKELAKDWFPVRVNDNLEDSNKHTRDLVAQFGMEVARRMFTEEQLRAALSEAFKASQEGYQITSDEIIKSVK